MPGSDDERGETTGLNSGEVLATLMDLGMERHHSAIAGSQVPKVLRPAERTMMHRKYVRVHQETSKEEWEKTYIR